MIAQDYFRARVLASGSIGMPYGVGSMGAHAKKKPSEGAASAICSREELRRTDIAF